MDSELPRMLPVSEAARHLGLSAQRLRTLADEGRVPCVRTSLGRLFNLGDIEEFRRTRGPFGRYQWPRTADAATPPTFAEGVSRPTSPQDLAAPIVPGSGPEPEPDDACPT
jgi:hypothetical protein